LNYDVNLLLSGLPEGRVFGLDQQTLISTLIQLFNACVLAVVLGFLLYKPVRNFLRTRSDKISGQIKDARAKMAEAEKVKAEYEQKLQDIDGERAKILEAAKAEAAESGKLIISQAKSEAASIKQRAEESALSEKERLKQDTKRHIIEVSSLMASKMVAQAMDSKEQDKLFENVISELEDATWRN